MVPSRSTLPRRTATWSCAASSNGSTSSRRAWISRRIVSSGIKRSRTPRSAACAVPRRRAHARSPSRSIVRSTSSRYWCTRRATPARRSSPCSASSRYIAATPISSPRPHSAPPAAPRVPAAAISALSAARGARWRGASGRQAADGTSSGPGWSVVCQIVSGLAAQSPVSTSRSSCLSIRLWSYAPVALSPSGTSRQMLPWPHSIIATVNLPPPPTPVIGRVREVAAMQGTIWYTGCGYSIHMGHTEESIDEP